MIQTIGLGPHRIERGDPARRGSSSGSSYGGILCDIASHQVDQFLFFTGSTKAEVVAAQVGNVHHPQYPGLEDFGDVMVRGDRGPATSAWTGSRPTGSPPGATGGSRSSAPTASSRSARTSTSPGARGRQPPLPGGPEGDALRRLPRPGAALRRAARRRTSSTGPRRRCRRRTASSRPSWCSRPRRPRNEVSFAERSAVMTRRNGGCRAGRRSRWRRGGIGASSVLAAGFPAIVPASVLGRHRAEQPDQRRRDRHGAHLARPTTCRASGSTTTPGSSPSATSTAAGWRTPRRS